MLINHLRYYLYDSNPIHSIVNRPIYCNGSIWFYLCMCMFTDEELSVCLLYLTSTCLSMSIGICGTSSIRHSLWHSYLILWVFMFRNALKQAVFNHLRCYSLEHILSSSIYIRGMLWHVVYWSLHTPLFLPLTDVAGICNGAFFSPSQYLQWGVGLMALK